MDDLHEIIVDAVYGQLADWGTSAKVVRVGNPDKPLRVLLNEQCDPLIEELYRRVMAWKNRNPGKIIEKENEHQK